MVQFAINLLTKNDNHSISIKMLSNDISSGVLHVIIFFLLVDPSLRERNVPKQFYQGCSLK